MLNPIAQVKQHKEVRAKDNPPTVKTVTSSDIAKQAVKQAPEVRKGKLTLTYHYPQIDYLFQQTKWNVANCKKNYPDCFHFKKALQKQLNALCNTLSESDRLFAELTSQNSRKCRENAPDNVGKGTMLSDEQIRTLKHHRKAVRYLTTQLQGVADYVGQVEQANGEQLDALCFRQE